jgi:hypothetical protein
MAEVNSAVAGLLDTLAEPPSPELAGMSPPPMMNFDIPPPPPEPTRRGFGARSSEDSPMKKGDATALLNGAKSDNSPTVGFKKFGELAKLVDTNARVRVRKRLPSGQLSHIDDYAKRDVETMGDVESFLSKWVKPQRGGGVYEISLVDPKGTEYHAGAYHLDGVDIDPNKGPASINGSASSFGEHATLMLMRDVLNRPQPLPPDPIEQLKKAQEFMDMANGGARSGGSNDTLFAIMAQQQRESSQQMIAMQQAQQAQMLALLQSKPTGPDPMLVDLISRMDRRMEKLEAAALAPPPPPPPPPMPSGPSYSMPELITAVATAAATFIPLIKGDGGLKPVELITMMQNAQAQTQTMMATVMGDRLTAKDMLALQRDQSSGTPTLVDQMQQLAAVKQFAAELSPPQQGPQGASFWDAIITLAGNTSLAESIGQRIANGSPAPAPRQITIEDHGRPQTAPVRDPQLAPAQQGEQAIPFPPNFPELCKAIDVAQDDAARATAVFETIKALQGIPQWHQFIAALTELIAKNEQPRAIAGLAQWLRTLVNAKLLSSAAADRAVNTFDVHFVHVRAEIYQRAPVLRQLAPEESVRNGGPIPPAAPAAAAPAPAPVAEEGEPEEGGDVATGPAPAQVELPDEYEQ